MRGNSLLLVSAICCFVAQAVPHGHEHDENVPATSTTPTLAAIETVPSNGTPAQANPTIAYIPPKDDVKHTHSDMDMDMGSDGMEDMNEHSYHNHTVPDGPISPEQMSYWLWPEHRGLLYAHITLMVISWAFLLPIGSFPQVHLLTCV
jgi:hypothetical protein